MSYQRCQYETSQRDLERWLEFIALKKKERTSQDHYFARIVFELSNLRRIVESRLTKRRYKPIKLDDCYVTMEKAKPKDIYSSSVVKRSLNSSKRLFMSIVGGKTKKVN